MIEPDRRGDAHLQALREGKQVIAAAVRERRTTHRRDTVVTPLRWWIGLVVLAACGGGPQTETYAKGNHELEACCEQIQGTARDQCLAAVPHVEDRGAAGTATNQQTYACVVDHFTCDPSTGRATQPSAQAQYDCIAELQ
jgi:hypothetical protein